MDQTEHLGAVPIPKQAGNRMPCLITISGPEKGEILPLRPGKLKMGRSPSADLVLRGPGISRIHAELEVDEQGGVTVQDLGSTNGIFVNGEPTKRLTLKDGDALGLGPEVTLRLEHSDQQVNALFQDMYRSANLDGLTGVLNRRSFMNRLQEELAAARRHKTEYSLALLDVDHFKSVNDRYGHPAGDAVLVELARRLKEALRQEDLVGRYGGEEFVVLLRQTPFANAQATTERIRKMVEATPFTLPDGTQLPVTTSIGLSRLLCEKEMDATLESADQALYQAKRNGRNRIWVAEGLQ
jgi:diguanylate cyclase (GGDEF)-like protein